MAGAKDYLLSHNCHIDHQFIVWCQEESDHSLDDAQNQKVWDRQYQEIQNAHNPRIPALPPSPVGLHGIYYHASFYDLQAASHITMLPNSTDFVTAELENAMKKGVHSFLIINCSNVRPHTYMLDHIAHIWGVRKNEKN